MAVGSCQAFLPPSLSITSAFHGSKSHLLLQGHRWFPYVENYEEQQLRILWEKDPFQTTRSTVDHYLTNKTDPYLLRTFNTTSEWDFLFSRLYGGDTTQNGIHRVCSEDPATLNDKRRHFAIDVAYRGDSFCGWQTQPHNSKPSVQETVATRLTVLERELCNREISDKSTDTPSRRRQRARPRDDKPVDIRVCGRTDAGVSAIGQICRFRSHYMNMTAAIVQNHLDEGAQNGDVTWKILKVTQVGRAFHPTFTATCRGYAYMIDLESFPKRFANEELSRLNQLLDTIEGKELDYVSVSYGKLKTKTSKCTIYHARAVFVEAKDGSRALCIELVGNRFLRRMVRLLVATLLSLAFQRLSWSDNDLLDILSTRQRDLAARPAPPDGLIFAGAVFGY